MDYEISIHELNARLQQNDDLLLVDVREPEELSHGMIEGAMSIPMGEIVNRIGELDPTQEVVVICRTGNRSRQVTQYLAQSGFPRVKNMSEGMNGWAREIDENMQVY